MKKSQVTLFAIIGIVLVAIMFIVLNRPAGNTSTDSINSLESEKSAITSIIKECAKTTLIKGMHKYGLNDMSPLNISEYINSNLNNCTNNLSDFKNRIDIKEGAISSIVEISYNLIYVKVDYPLELKKGANSVSLESVESILPRSISASAAGIRTLISADGSFAIDFPENVKITKSGEPVKEISLKMYDSGYLENNKKNTGIKIAYVIEPDIKISEPVQATFYADDPPGTGEAVKILYYENREWKEADAKVDSISAAAEIPQITATLYILEGKGTGYSIKEQKEGYIIELPMDPSIYHVTKKGEYGQTTSAWASSNNMNLAINGNFFNTGNRQLLNGLSVSDGISDFQDTKMSGIFAAYDDGTFDIVDLWTSTNVKSDTNAIIKKGIKEALSGQPVLVKDSKIMEDYIKWYPCDASLCFSYADRPRTILGINKNEKKVFIIIVKKSNLMDAAQMAIDAGATDALNLDGGGSTTLWKDGNLLFSGDISEGRGSERTVGNHLGITASDIEIGTS